MKSIRIATAVALTAVLAPAALASKSESKPEDASSNPAKTVKPGRAVVGALSLNGDDLSVALSCPVAAPANCTGKVGVRPLGRKSGVALKHVGTPIAFDLAAGATSTVVFENLSAEAVARIQARKGKKAQAKVVIFLPNGRKVVVRLVQDLTPAPAPTPAP